jgi:hypothetical protein
MTNSVKCSVCGSDTYRDDDLHWLFCKNSECSESWENTERAEEYDYALENHERELRERALENGESPLVDE